MTQLGWRLIQKCWRWIESLEVEAWLRRDNHDRGTKYTQSMHAPSHTSGVSPPPPLSHLFFFALSPHHPPHHLLMCDLLHLCQTPEGVFSIGTFHNLERDPEVTISFLHVRLCLDMAEKGHHAQEECVFDGCHERVGRGVT